MWVCQIHAKLYVAASAMHWAEQSMCNVHSTSTLCGITVMANFVDFDLSLQMQSANKLFPMHSYMRWFCLQEQEHSVSNYEGKACPKELNMWFQNLALEYTNAYIVRMGFSELVKLQISNLNSLDELSVWEALTCGKIE